ncbi:PLP-dependent aminotransferase family protein [Denitrobaculum tricleocarpae]|uniref:PLP-dependent aminotransferase family protein n=1 Tax=Denitrobaculum tricleocarpae TaxID=2591009 RepID=A0A545TYD3_9PROT|nr:PLP-dependent aminotransferase family protein [Denitrobaculum tricleocarpae]TQV82204.1 PLP-dependent aminotransferase family protein [Denitrobaculum tricleocarpae]
MAIWLPDLTGRRGPKYLQILEAMAEDIASERLTAGTQLPPHRELAYQLGVSANTTSRAYAEAVKRALLRGEVGRGTFVRSPDASLQADEQAHLRRERTGPVDLSRNLPLPGFAEPHIRRVLGEVAAGDGLSGLLDYQTDEDLLHHSEAARIWLNSCGVEAQPDQIVTTMGGQHGLFCALMGLLRPGDLLLTESLTYMPVRAMAERFGLQTAAVTMDARGVVPEAFEKLCIGAKPKAFYLTPTLQAPTTTTLPAARRRSIADIAQRHGVILIEDDVFAPLKADRPAPLATSAPDQTVYVTSLSKTVAPGLRVGFLRAPAALVPALHHATNLSVWMTPPMTLEVAARLIRDGTAARLTAQQRAAAERRQSLARSILGHVEFAADPQGFHVWMPLPGAWRADTFRAHCARHDVLVSEGRSFAARVSDAPEAIRICLSHEADEIRLKRGLQTIANLLRLAPSESALEI